MFYLSELINKRISDRQGNTVARIRDLVVELSDLDTSAGGSGDKQPPDAEEDEEHRRADVPVVKGMLARTSRKHQPFFLPVSQVESLGSSGARLVSPKLDLQAYEQREGEMLLARDLWDKQIIDLESYKVVRVNDVVLSGSAQAAEPDQSNVGRWWVRGVDVGVGGLLRRLRLASLVCKVMPRAAHPHIVRWQHLDVFGSNVLGGVPLKHKKLARLHPVEIARITDAVSYHQGAEIIASLDDTLAADTLEEIVTDRQTDIVEYIPEDRVADILEEMSPDEATDLLAELPAEKAGSLLEQMDQEDAEEVRHLMRYPEHSAGGIMTTDFVRVTPTKTISEVIEANKPVLMSADLIYYMYVVDSKEDADAERLVGVITVRDLLVHDRDTPVGDFMLRDFLSVRPGEGQQEVARKMAEYNLLALPVVDRNDVLLGVVTVDDALDALLPEGWKKRLPKIFS